MLTVRAALVEAGDAGQGTQRLGVDLVGVQPAQFLGQFLAERAAYQRNRAVPSSRVSRRTSPLAQLSSTVRIRGYSLVGSSTGLMPSRAASQPRIRAAVGSCSGATTVAPVTRASTVSNELATSVRHGVIRVQARSVSPGA
jgi:hypothetical protein